MKYFIWQDSRDFPSNAKDIKGAFTGNIKEIKISPEKKNISNLIDGCLVGKYNDNSVEFDTLIYAFFSIKKIQISSTFKHICSTFFCNYQQLLTAEFSDDYIN